MRRPSYIQLVQHCLETSSGCCHKQEEIDRQAAIEEHYRRERAKEIGERLRVAEQERQVRRPRVAVALNIPIDEVPQEI